ncbi:MAG TPA: aminopeptidase P N-terminal domain-containing protein [Gemmatimonadales bacterium]|nr:aminopeptidase P N-terminal domain-containing protein [Gemmatimonadales bacterium]
MRSASCVVVCIAFATVAGAQARAAPATAPIGAWTPVPELPGMGRPVDTAAVAARRRAVAARIGRGVVLVPAAHERDIEREVIQDNDFRQNNTFFYLTGLETQDAWLLVAPGGETILFLPPRNPSQERWTGLRLGPDSIAARLSGITHVLPTDSLDPVLASFAFHPGAGGGPLYVPLDATTRDESRVRDLAFAGRDVRNLRPIVDSMRLIKDADEIARMRKAMDISAAGHVAAMQAARPGMWEYEIEAVLEAAFRRNGADRVGYPSIVGSGPNSTTLHYDVNRRQTKDGDLVVVDAGAEWGQYTADVTRTFPVNGKFTTRQKAIYDLVLATQQAAFDSTHPGTTIARLNRVAREYMRDHSGTLCGDQSCDAYFIHGLSHWLGMDVHDVGDYSSNLRPGMVLTIEPGIYLPQEALGVRIEDDVLVTATGAEWLSANAPKTTADIERLMSRPSRP